MALTYGYLKAHLSSTPKLDGSRKDNEIQYHLIANLLVTGANGAKQTWQTAINVGTNDSDDLLQYQLVTDFAHPILSTLRAAPMGFNDLTSTGALPALDFLRSNILSATGAWRPSGIMDGSTQVEPVASLLRLLESTTTSNATLYIFGRKYLTGLGIHDVHMNQGSTGSFLNNGVNDDNDHNAIWQDGAVIVDTGDTICSAYFAAFAQQLVPTDNLGNPTPNAHPITTADDGSQQS